MANIRSLAAVPDSELQMGQSSVRFGLLLQRNGLLLRISFLRPDAVTLAADSAIALALEFDSFGLVRFQSALISYHISVDIYSISIWTIYSGVRSLFCVILLAISL